MTTAGRRGRRDNGLDAPDWRAIQDLDPRLSEDVLDALGAQGIAAYVQPAVDVDPVTRSATLPSRPSDRLFVDRRQADAARELVRQLLAGSSTSTVDAGLDATFAQIVAGFDRAADTSGSWPASENVTSPAQPEPEPDPPPPEPDRARPVDGRHLTEPSLLDALEALDRAPPVQPDEDELPEQYDPPPPPPLPRLPGQGVWGALAVLAGLVLVVVRPSFVPLDRSATMLLGFAAMLGGAAALIALLRPGTDPDEDTRPDDGATI